MKVYKIIVVIVIQIKDNGIGIDKKEIEHLFEPYIRLETGLRRTGGMGVGIIYIKNYYRATWRTYISKSQKGAAHRSMSGLPIK